MGKKWKLADFLFLGSKMTVDVECSNEIKRHLLRRRKAMTNLDNVLKSRDNGTSLVAQLVKNLPAMQETLVRFLGQKDPLEKG